SDAAYGTRLRRLGFHPIAEIQPSRHRVSVSLAEGTDDEAVRAAFTKSTGQRRGFRFGPRDVFIDWWLAALEAGMLVYLDAWDGSDRSRSLGGLILYRHGTRLSTVHS